MNNQDKLTSLALACAFLFGSGSALAGPQDASPQDTGKSSSAAQAVDDAWITAKVKAELATTAGVPANDITVKTVDGVVTLTGALDGDLTVKKAIAAARSVKGVKQVDDSGLTARH